ncbi:hypothetical protein ACLOJK_012209 [Asimina triloba]
MSNIHEALGVDAAKEVVSFSSPSAKEPSELGGVEELAGHHSSHLLPLVARRGGGNSEVAPACILRSGAIATGLVVNMASCFFKNSQAILGHVKLDRALKELQGRTPPTLSMNEAKAQRLELDFAKAERLEVVETEWRKLRNQLQALERVLGDFEAA